MDARAVARAVAVPVVPPRILGASLLEADFEHRCGIFHARIQQLRIKLVDLMGRDPLPEIAIANTRRLIDDASHSIDALQRDALPFVKAVSKSDDTAEDICRRYYARFQGNPQQSLGYVSSGENILSLKSFAQRIAANMTSTAPSTCIPMASRKRDRSDSTDDMNPPAAKRVKVLKAKGTDRWCNACNCARTIDEPTNTYICRRCGTSVEFLDNDTKNFSYNKHYQMTKPLGYEHVNHFRKLLMHIQAKERTTVETAVIDELRRLFNSGPKLANNGHITAQTIKAKLRRIGRADLYPHIAQIELILTGRPPLSLTVQQERMLIKMFHQHRQGYETYKKQLKKDTVEVIGKRKGPRSNLLYYNYLLGKFAEILEDREQTRTGTTAANVWTRLRERVNRLKSPTCVQDHDRIHRQVCLILGSGWTFKPSTVGMRNNATDLTKLKRGSHAGPSTRMSLADMLGASTDTKPEEDADDTTEVEEAEDDENYDDGNADESDDNDDTLE